MSKKMISVSQSMLNCVAESMRTFVGGYVLKQQERSIDFLIRGNAYHTYLEHYSLESYKLFKDLTPDAEKRKIINSNLSNIIKVCSAAAKKDLEKGQGMDVDQELFYIQLMGNAYIRNKLPMLVVEQKLDETMNDDIKERGRVFRGVLDEVDVDTLSMNDHKTVGRLTSTIEQKKKVQAFVYSRLFEDEYGLRPSRMRYKNMIKPSGKSVGKVDTMRMFFDSIGVALTTELDKKGKPKKATRAVMEQKLEEIGIVDDYLAFVYENAFDDVYLEVDVEINDEFFEEMEPIVKGLVEDAITLLRKYENYMIVD